MIDEPKIEYEISKYISITGVPREFRRTPDDYIFAYVYEAIKLHKLEDKISRIIYKVEGYRKVKHDWRGEPVYSISISWNEKEGNSLYTMLLFYCTTRYSEKKGDGCLTFLNRVDNGFTYRIWGNEELKRHVQTPSCNLEFMPNRIKELIVLQ